MAQKSSLVLLLLFASIVAAQTPTPPQIPAGPPPSRPRLLFNQAQKAALQAKVLAAGTVSNATYSTLANSGSFVTVGPPSINNQRNHVVKVSLRNMTELAFRYQMTGDVSKGNAAKNILLSACNYFIPDTSNSSLSVYQNSTFPCALGLTFDMVYPLLSASERATVVNHLEQWLSTLLSSHHVSSFSSYVSATNNFSFSWISGVALTGLAIWGESNYSNLEQIILGNLIKLQGGYRDYFSPDGSVDGNFGYYNYGPINSLNAAIAAKNSGWGDIMAGTNVLKSQRWLATALVGSEFPWIGDSSVSHKGLRLDPVGYYVIHRTQDEVGLWGRLRLESLQPMTDWTVSQAYSPWLLKAIYYPDGLSPQPPAMLSGFFRDNLNQGTPTSCSYNAYVGVGEGGHAILHNSTESSDRQISVYYQIRDEWMPHSHEDDGHLSIMSEGKHQHRDPGYTGIAGAQSTAHNIVISGSSGFRGNNTNYYGPPSPNGRFLGKRESLALTPTFDYVRGNHSNMWMMQKADRSVLMVKDPNDPYVVVVSNVYKTGGLNTYREQWWGSAYATGQGTASSPMTIFHGSKPLRTVYLSPATVSVATGGTLGAAKKSEVVASGYDVSFVSVHAKAAPSGSSALLSPQPNTTGGTMIRSGNSDKILVSTDGNPLGDGSTSSDGRMAWIRTTSAGSLSEWMALEATTLTHVGQSLFTSSVPVSIAVRQGEIHVQTLAGAGAANLSVSAHCPFVVTVLTVDGVATSFTQSGSNVTIGGGTGPSGPTLSLDDRFYHFDEGVAGDLVNLSGNVLLTGSGAFTSTSGWATAELKGGASFVPRPISISMSVSFLPGAFGNEVVVFAGGSPGAGDVFELRVAPQGYGLSVDVVQGGNSLISSPVPFALSGSHGRFSLVYDPLGGLAEIRDALGTSLALAPVPNQVTPYHLTLSATNFAHVDDVAIFDSAEDGVTPQGVVFWGTPCGKAGCAIHVPHVFSSQSAALYYNGALVPPDIVSLWFIACGMIEAGSSPYLVDPSQAPPAVREVIFQSTAYALFPYPGQQAAFSLTSMTGVALTGSFEY